MKQSDIVQIKGAKQLLWYSTSPRHNCKWVSKEKGELLCHIRSHELIHETLIPEMREIHCVMNFYAIYILMNWYINSDTKSWERDRYVMTRYVAYKLYSTVCSHIPLVKPLCFRDLANHCLIEVANTDTLRLWWKTTDTWVRLNWLQRGWLCTWLWVSRNCAMGYL